MTKILNIALIGQGFMPAQSFHVLAAGYHSGAVTLCQPDSDSFLLIKGAGGGAPTALAWSPDGERLAFGTQDGWLGWIELPDPVFRNHRPATARP